MKTTGRIIGAILLILAIVLAFVGYYIGTNCLGREPVNLTSLPDPMRTVKAFFDSVAEENYPEAYSYLSGYESLGLEKTPEDAYAAAFWKIVRGNTSWESSSDCKVNGTEAKTEVTLISPDLNLLVEGLGEDVNKRIEQKIEEAVTLDGIYNEDKSYKQEFIMEVYDEVLRERLQKADYPLRRDTVSVSLTYSDKRWLILPDAELMNALTGGAA